MVLPIASASNRVTTPLAGSRVVNHMPPTRAVARPCDTAGSYTRATATSQSPWKGHQVEGVQHLAQFILVVVDIAKHVHWLLRELGDGSLNICHLPEPLHLVEAGEGDAGVWVEVEQHLDELPCVRCQPRRAAEVTLPHLVIDAHQVLVLEQ
ncbi:Os06g0570700 [Oryza sativa Japonica Group]|uniref:Os06g0570700 protein n=3 Tax=Oryza sativa TaxID=4530 RepID=A3BCX7_ORYSJ|nr:hypothetical protein OsI_23431 [Oryza sativa Indica Group]EAZ37416.1 hypothetical protein OsJ_21751 [Oryza sativa Japonica Group]BAS98315.1 Os06g0570700 [Oryza sativa Japonica Group]